MSFSARFIYSINKLSGDRWVPDGSLPRGSRRWLSGDRNEPIRGKYKKYNLINEATDWVKGR